MYQQTLLVGNLGRDPEGRYTPAGKFVANFSMATSKHWTNANGEAQERTTWWRVSVFGKAGEACNEYLKKGSKVLVVGEIQSDPKTGNPRMFKRNDGTEGTSFELTALTVKFLTPRGGGTNGHSDEPEAVIEHGDEAEIPF